MLLGIILSFEVFRSMGEEKFQKLKIYLKENLAKNFIKKSTSPVEHVVFFILKKNDSNRLYLDYYKINDITIKNRYLISNIKELQNRI